MAARIASIQRLQVIADDFQQPGYRVKVVSPKNKDDVLKAGRLLEEVWTVGEPLSVAITSDPEYRSRGIESRFRQFCLECCRLSSEQSLLLAVVSTTSGEMVSLLVGMPCTPDVYPQLTKGAGERDLMAPWLDILHMLDGPLDKAVNQLDDVSKASIKLLDFFGYATSKLHEGRHLTHLLRDAMFRVGLELGYTNAIGKFSSNWQKAITSRWGWDYLGEAVYHDYEWQQGQKPFKTIPTPAAVQLAWVNLASTQAVHQPALPSKAKMAQVIVKELEVDEIEI